MKKITTSNGSFIFVEVPDFSYNFQLYSFVNDEFKQILFLIYSTDKPNIVDLGEINCSYDLFGKIISTTKDITEKEAKIICPYVKGYGYRNFNVSDYNGGSSPFDVWIPYSCKTSKESLLSLIKSSGLDVNKTYLIILQISLP